MSEFDVYTEDNFEDFIDNNDTSYDECFDDLWHEDEALEVKEEKPYGDYSYCKSQCEFFSKCQLGEWDCVKKNFDESLCSLASEEETIIRRLYGIELEETESLESIAKSLEMSCEEVIQIRDSALKRLRYSTDDVLYSDTMCLTLMASNESRYFNLWKNIYEKTKSKEELYVEFLEYNICAKGRHIARVQEQIARAQWLKKKTVAKLNITPDTVITDCCFGDPFEGMALESNTTLGELEQMNGQRFFKLCKYKQYLFEELITVVFANGIYFADYSPEISIQEYCNMIYNDFPSKLKMDIVNKPIESLELSVRAFVSIDRAGIDTVAELILCTEEELGRLRNITPRILQEVKTKLGSMNLCLLSSEIAKE